MHPTQKPAAELDVSPAEVLRGAALYLARHGWHQGGFYDVTSDEVFPPACAAGAIRVAVCGEPVSDLVDQGDRRPQAQDVIMAQRVLAAYLDHEFLPWEASSLDIVGDWNDEDGRTTEQVIAALNAAADEWDLFHPALAARDTATLGGAR
jgi:hypothetical protein